MVQMVDNMGSRIKEKCDELGNVVEAVLNLQKNIENYK